jgi:Skp family chaperone for outer membrane proteins
LIVKHTTTRLCIAAAALLAGVSIGGCAQAHSRIAVVRVTEVEANWPEFQNYYNQLQANYQAISQAKASAADKRKALAQFQAQEKSWNDKVTAEVRAVVDDIAKRRNYQLVVTREGTAYGGDDITTDVEKALKITPPSPTPK